MPALRPAYALADMLARKGWGLCGLAPDGIAWSLATKDDCDDWAAAAAAFKLVPALVEE